MHDLHGLGQVLFAAHVTRWNAAEGSAVRGQVKCVQLYVTAQVDYRSLDGADHGRACRGELCGCQVGVECLEDELRAHEEATVRADVGVDVDLFDPLVVGRGLDKETVGSSLECAGTVRTVAI